VYDTLVVECPGPEHFSQYARYRWALGDILHVRTATQIERLGLILGLV
jgi:hypothetical protein